MKKMAGKIATVTTAIMAAGIMTVSPANAQSVDYHKSQQAGKVWGDKISENNRKNAAARNAQVNSEGIRYDAPLTESDWKIALEANRADYQELHDSVGKKNADRWLEYKARRMRAER